MALSKGQLLEKAQHFVNLLYHEYTCQPFYVYRRDIFYHKSAKIFRRGLITSEDVRRRSKDFRRCYEEFRRTKENSEKLDHPHRLFFSLFGSGLFK